MTWHKVCFGTQVADFGFSRMNLEQFRYLIHLYIAK